MLATETATSRVYHFEADAPLPVSELKWSNLMKMTSRGLALALPESVSLPLGAGTEFITSDTMRRVLLMAPMRAPPV